MLFVVRAAHPACRPTGAGCFRDAIADAVMSYVLRSARNPHACVRGAGNRKPPLGSDSRRRPRHRQGFLRLPVPREDRCAAARHDAGGRIRRTGRQEAFRRVARRPEPGRKENARRVRRYRPPSGARPRPMPSRTSKPISKSPTPSPRTPWSARSITSRPWTTTRSRKVPAPRTSARTNSPPTASASTPRSIGTPSSTSRAEKHGFRILESAAEPQGLLDCYKHDGRIALAVAQFTGFLEVTEPLKYSAVVTSGIGRGKAFGFGLLSVVPG